MKKTLFFLFSAAFLFAAGTVTAANWTKKVVGGVEYYYDDVLGAKWNYTEQEYEYKVVKDGKLCYQDEKYGTVCDSMPVCYVSGFYPEDGKVVIPATVPLYVRARNEKMGKYRHCDMLCTFRVKGLNTKSDVVGQFYVKEFTADISNWEHHDGTEILSFYDLEGMTNLESLTLKENMTDENYNVPSGLTKLPDGLVKRNKDKLKKISISAPNFKLQSGDGVILKFCDNLEYISFTSSVQMDIPENLCSGMKNLQTFLLSYKEEDYQHIKGTVGNSAFYNCKALQRVTLEHIASIGDNAFRNCSGLQYLTINPSYGTALETIGNYAFSGAKLPNAALVFDGINKPQGSSGWLNEIKSLGDGAFEMTNIESVSFMGYVPATLGDGIFSDCKKLKSFTVDKANVALLAINRSNQLANNMLNGCTALTNITVYNDNKDLGKSNYAWPWTPQCTQIVNFTYKGTASNIVPSGFLFNTTSLKYFTAENTSDAFIGSNAFEKTALPCIPYTVLEAHLHAFENSKLQSVKFATGTKDKPVIIARWAFQNTQLKSLIFEDGVYEFWEDAFAFSPITYVNFSAIEQDWTAVEHARSMVGDKEKEASELSDIKNAIPATMFDGCPIKTLKLSPKTERVQFGAFRGNNLTSIYLPNAVTDVQYAAFALGSFAECQSVQIGKKVSKIGENAFNRYYADENTYDPANGIKEVIWLSSVYTGKPMYTIFQDVESIRFASGDDYCETLPDNLCRNFNQKVKIISVSLPAKMTRIGKSAFNASFFISAIHIPQECEEIGDSAFYNMVMLKDVYIPSDGKLKRIGNAAFGSNGLSILDGKIILPQGLETVGRNALPRDISTIIYHCRNLKTVNPFSGCKRITAVDMREGVESLPDSLFSSTAVTVVTIPSTVTSIGRAILAGCQSLNKNNITIYYNAVNATLTPRGFNTDDEQMLINPMPMSTLKDKPWVLNPWGVEKVANVVNKLDYYDDFKGYKPEVLKSFYDIKIGESVESIPDFFFAGFRTHRYALQLPASVKKIGKWAFYRSDIREVETAATTLGDHAFCRADSLRKATLTEVSELSDKAFAEDVQLTAVSAPKTTQVGVGAFRNCAALGGISLPLVTRYGNSAFANCKKLHTASFPASLEAIGDSAFYACNEFIDSDLSEAKDGLTIGNSALEGTDLATLRLPAGSTIGENAFKNSDISAMMLENLDAVPQIHANTFEGVSRSIWVFVNCAAKPLFAADDNWKEFTQLQTRSKYSLTITPTSMEEGSVDATSPDCDNKVTITATPTKLFSFKQWSDGNTDNPRTLTLTEDMELGAEFAKTGTYTMRYMLFRLDNPDHGTITPNPSDWYPIEYEGAAEKGPINNITVTSNEHYIIDFVQSVGVYDKSGNWLNTSLSFMCQTDNGLGNCIEASLSLDYAEYDDLLDPACSDTVYITIPTIGEQLLMQEVFKRNDDEAGGLYQYYDIEDYYKQYGFYYYMDRPTNYGAEVAIYAHPFKGFIFTGWDDGIKDEVRTFTIGDQIHTANFEPQPIVVTFMTNQPELALIDGKASYEEAHIYGDKLALPEVAISEAAGKFDHWEVNGEKDFETEVSEGKTYLKAPLTEDLKVEAVFQLNEVKLTVSSSDNAMGTASAMGELPHYYGEKVTLTATPSSEDYLLTNWSDGVTDNPREVTLTHDTVIVAHFAANVHTVGISIIPSDAAVATGMGEYPFGAEYTLTVTPNQGYELKEWRDGVALEEKSNTLVGLVYGDISIEAEFQLQSFDILTAVNDINGGTVEGGGKYQYGTQATLTAKPAENWVFVGWEDDKALPAERKVTVNENATYKALFEHDIVSVIAKSDNELQGSVSVQYGDNVPYGTSTVLTATPKEGYEFTGWSDESKDNPHTVIAGEVNNLTAFFAPKTYHVAVAPFSPKYGSVTLDAEDGKYTYHSYAHIELKVNEGYWFTGWDNGETDDDYYLFVKSDTTVTASFTQAEQPVTFTVTAYVSPANSGEVFGSGIYNEGKTVSLAAIANEGWKFDKWEDGTTDNPRTITADKDYTLIAYFVKDTGTGVDNVQSDNVQCTKVLENGVLYLIHKGTKYNIQGQVVK